VLVSKKVEFIYLSLDSGAVCLKLRPNSRSSPPREGRDSDHTRIREANKAHRGLPRSAPRFEPVDILPLNPQSMRSPRVNDRNPCSVDIKPSPPYVAGEQARKDCQCDREPRVLRTEERRTQEKTRRHSEERNSPLSVARSEWSPFRTYSSTFLDHQTRHLTDLTSARPRRPRQFQCHPQQSRTASRSPLRHRFQQVPGIRPGR
jgi:hypothetical protein